VIAQLGGLHEFARWDGPILTDSGGFQLFSLGENVVVRESAVTFRSHLDGRTIELSPERAVEIQELLGGDVAMVLDHVVALPCDGEVARDACERTVRWAERCRKAARRPDQVQFGIVQGALDCDLRADCARRLQEFDFAGYAVGGLSVGEDARDRNRVLEATCSVLPSDKPRYLMGVGTPTDILEGIRRGVDMFDCVIPTRNGRNALAYTDSGTLRMRNRVHERDSRPLQEGCPCPACQHSRGYLRHLFVSGEMLGPVLLSAHNLTYYQRLMAEARQAIRESRFMAFLQGKELAWSAERQGGSGPSSQVAADS
jgi:queuine tRNA-ribosyltransferase